MKRIIYRVLTFLFVLSLLAGMFIAYAEMNAEKETEKGEITPIDHGFYLAMVSGGVTAVGDAQLKIASDNYAHYSLSTITNTSTYPIYINVRDQTGVYIVGTAHKIYAGTSAPITFNVNYLSGQGNVNDSYRPSGQTSSSSSYGAYVQGNWIP